MHNFGYSGVLLPFQSIEMLTINEETSKLEDLVELMWKALAYFPSGIWTGVNYMGNVNLGSDLEIELKEELHKTFVFPQILKRIRKVKKKLMIQNFMFAVTHNPVVMLHYRFHIDTFKRRVSLIHDYAAADVGLLSLFKNVGNDGVKIAAHGLGHSQGLDHHGEPVDLMYVGLLTGTPIKMNKFCHECLRELKARKKSKLTRNHD